jgi:GT2 family glycosyltransferase
VLGHIRIFISLTWKDEPMDYSSFIDQVLFVVVLYKRQAQESPPIQLLTTTLAPKATVFIYDNSPQPTTHPADAVYVHDPSNGGVARAYNQANKTAKSLNKAWMMLLDQDTVIDEIFLRELSAEVNSHPNSVLFAATLKDRRGIVSPFRWRGTSGKRLPRVGTSLNLQDFRFQNSGLLVRTDAFEQVGGYDERITLDFSDIAFGEKMLRVTDHFVVVKHVLVHGFSETEYVTNDSARHRYDTFCSGAVAMGEIFEKRWPFYFRALLRGLKLTLRYRDPAFIKIFFTS